MAPTDGSSRVPTPLNDGSALCVSIGDAGGIGPDVLLQAWEQALADDVKLPKFFVLGDVSLLNERASILKLNARAADACATSLPDHLLPVISLNNELHSQPGKTLAQDAAGVIEAITRGVEMIGDGKASGLVTLPINKKHLYDAGFKFPGHTEYLGALAEKWPNSKNQNAPTRAVMMLAGPSLRTVPITIHIPVSEVPNALTSELIIETARIVHHDMRARFGILQPRLAFSGLNPHAGENGAMGTEDRDIIAPALDTLRNEGIECIGPLPADTMFHDRARQGYDVALCMYHDQALIPAKALAFDDSVNVTLGLPFIRTSPDHGTAYDIAGTGKANPSSFIAALKMAAEMVQFSQSNGVSKS